jgi:endoglucanase
MRNHNAFSRKRLSIAICWLFYRLNSRDYAKSPKEEQDIMTKNKNVCLLAPEQLGLSTVFLSLFACLLLVSLTFGQQTFVGVHGQLSVKGPHIVDQYGNQLQLHGMSMYGWTSNCGYDFYNASAINHLAQDWKCTAIRMPYMPGGAIAMSYINAVIDACIANGIYVIIDWHDGSSNASAAQASTFFKTIATSYHKYPNIMYEPWNEPNGCAWPTVIKPYMETVIGAIRAIDSNNIIICGNPSWDQQPQLAAASPITDYKNIAYSMHFYAQSHPVASFGPGITTSMNDSCAIFITEYGTCNASGGGPIDLAATEAWYNFLDKNKIGCTNWGVECEDGGGAACFTQSANANGPWPSSVMTAEGAFVQNYIDTSYQGLSVGVVQNGSRLQQRVRVTAMAGPLTGGTATASVFTMSGVRCPAGRKLPNGLYIIRDPGNNCVLEANLAR